MKEFLVKWTADGYCVEFQYIIVHESLDKAKELWNKYVKTHEKIQYSWSKAVKAAERHYGGYISWEGRGDIDKIKGCYKTEQVRISTGSDHLWD